MNDSPETDKISLEELKAELLRLKQAEGETEAQNRKKSKFFSILSHEIRSPLNTIIGYAELLQEEAREQGYGTMETDIEKIKIAGNQLLCLLNNVIDFFKLESGRMEFHPEEFEIIDMVNNTVSLMERVIEKNSNTLEIRYSHDIGTMYADINKVNQILVCLVINAVKRTHNGTITLSASREETDGQEWVKITVSDTGPAINEELLREFSQPLSKMYDLAQHGQDGIGLGLRVSKSLCQLMGGDLSVESVSDKGAVFTVTIPSRVSILTWEKTQEEKAPLRTAMPLEKIKNGATVLVIDDDENVGDLLTRYLSKEGFNVQWASNGHEGLNMARTLRPNAIILDLLMPGVDGWAVLTSLKTDPHLSSIPVIMLTCIDNKNMGFSLGASEYLTKPINKDQITSVIKKYIKDGEKYEHRILIIEDDDITRELLANMLKKAGCIVHEAENGRTGLEEVGKNVPTLIILDLMMPEMDGFQFISRLRSVPAYREIPILVMTAMNLSVEDRLRLNGCVDYIFQKDSYNRDDLLREISELTNTCISFIKAKNNNNKHNG